MLQQVEKHDPATIYCISGTGVSGNVWVSLSEEVRKYGGEVYSSMDLLAWTE